LTGFQNVYVRTPSGDLVAYTRLPPGNWITADFSSLYRLPKIASDGLPFTDPFTGFQNVYGTTGAGHVVEYTRLPPGNWIAVDLTSQWRGPAVIGDAVPFTDPLTGFQNAYVRTGSGGLAAYTRLPDGSWIAADFTARYGLPKIFSDPQPFVDPATGYQSVFVRATAANRPRPRCGASTAAPSPPPPPCRRCPGSSGRPTSGAATCPRRGRAGPVSAPPARPR